MTSRNARIKGTNGVEMAPADLGDEVHPRDLVEGEEYYYIPHPDTPTSNRSRFGKNLPHKYYKGIYTGTRSGMGSTAYMKKVDASGRFDDYTLVSMKGFSRGIFYKVMKQMSAAQKMAALAALRSGDLPSEARKHIINYANMGYKPNNSTKKSSSSSGGSSGGRRKPRRTRSLTRKRSR